MTAVVEQLDHDHVDAATCATCIRRRRVADDVARELAHDQWRALTGVFTEGPTKIIARRIAWLPGDARGARQIIGRADVVITPAGCSSLRVAGVVVASADPRNLGARWVEYFDPSTGLLTRGELTGDGGGYAER